MYPDEPLGHREIRLLYMTRSDKAPNGRLLELKRVSLDGAPNFVAVSYARQLNYDRVSAAFSTGEEAAPTDLSSTGEEAAPTDLSIADSHSWSVIEPFEEGQSRQPLEIHCNQRSLLIWDDFYYFLQHLGARDELEAVWIDALCVNLDDLDEKSAQMMLMGEIYRSCSKVYIWLGLSSIPEYAMRVVNEFIPAILEDFERRGQDTAFYTNKDMFCSDHELAGSVGSEVCKLWRSHWREFMDIFERTWFLHRWIVQEACARGKKECLFLAGDQEIEYRRLEGFDEFLARTGWNQQLYQITTEDEFILVPRGMAIFSNLRSIFSALPNSNEHKWDYLATIYGAKNEEQRWYAAYAEAINHIRWRGQTDPRDKIYACLGMISASAPANLRTKLRANYHLTVEEVYTNFATLCIDENPSISLLSTREDLSARRFEELPSWVPDFSVGMTHNALIRSSDWFRDDEGRDYVFGRNFDAFKPATRKQPGRREVIGRALVLHGTYLTAISWCGPEEILDDKVLTALYAAKFAMPDGSYLSTGDSMYDAVWKTLIVDDPPPNLNQLACPKLFRAWLLSQLSRFWRTGGNEHPELVSFLEHHSPFQQQMEALLGLEDDNDNGSTEDRQPGRRLFTLAEVAVAAGEQHSSAAESTAIVEELSIKAFDVAVSIALRGRRLCTSYGGHLVLGPRSIQRGDEIWLLEGVKVPIVLRKLTSRRGFSLVGESYVHGCMYGEGMTAQRQAQMTLLSIS